MTAHTPPQRFVAYLHLADRPGTLSAVAEVVSTRGVSIEFLATGDVGDGITVMTLGFATSDRLQRLIERTLARLAVVEDVRILAADDPQVLAAGVIHPDPSAPMTAPKAPAAASRPAIPTSNDAIWVVTAP